MNYNKRGTALTNKEFDNKIIDSNFRRISDYTNTYTSIKLECKICGKEYMKKPKEFKRLVCKCIIRSNNYQKSIEDKHISLIDTYTNMRDKLLHRCNNCNTEFRSSPRTVQSAVNGCSVCSGKKFNKKKYEELLPPDVKIIGDYIDTATKTKHECLICNNIWETKPNYIIHTSTGCPICNSSKGERIIRHVLNDLKIEYIREYSIDILGKKLRFDFYIESLNLLIEYDGIQHFQSVEFFGGDDEFKRIQIRDNMKNEWAIDNDILLIRIPYTISDADSIKQIIKNSCT